MKNNKEVHLNVYLKHNYTLHIAPIHVLAPKNVIVDKTAVIFFFTEETAFTIDVEAGRSKNRTWISDLYMYRVHRVNGRHPQQTLHLVNPDFRFKEEWNIQYSREVIYKKQYFFTMAILDTNK